MTCAEWPTYFLNLAPKDIFEKISYAKNRIIGEKITLLFMFRSKAFKHITK